MEFNAEQFQRGVLACSTPYGIRGFGTAALESLA